jgi:hypothetical protein
MESDLTGATTLYILSQARRTNTYRGIKLEEGLALAC